MERRRRSCCGEPRPSRCRREIIGREKKEGKVSDVIYLDQGRKAKGGLVRRRNKDSAADNRESLKTPPSSLQSPKGQDGRRRERLSRRATTRKTQGRQTQVWKKIRTHGTHRIEPPNCRHQLRYEGFSHGFLYSHAVERSIGFGFQI